MSRRATATVQERLTADLTDMKTRKADAEKAARAQGHVPNKWARRLGDQYGRQDCRCIICNQVLTVAVEEPTAYQLPLVYGGMLTTPCKGVAEKVHG